MIYVDDKTPTERRADPLERERPFLVSPIRFKPSEGLPHLDWMEDKLRGHARFTHDMIDGEMDKLLADKALDEISSYNDHAFGGWPNPVQFLMEYDCEKLRRGLSPDDKISKQRLSSLKKGAADWRLLLQLCSDDNLAWIWGDMGMLYVMCREQDIADRRFDRTCVIMQCH